MTKECRDKVINYTQCYMGTLAVELCKQLDIGGRNIQCKIDDLNTLEIYL